MKTNIQFIISRSSTQVQGQQAVTVPALGTLSQPGGKSVSTEGDLALGRRPPGRVSSPRYGFREDTQEKLRPGREAGSGESKDGANMSR